MAGIAVYGAGYYQRNQDGYQEGLRKGPKGTKVIHSATWFWTRNFRL